MPEKISIVKESGETISSNIVSVFTIPDTEKKYIITTENAVDPHGLTVLHVSEIADGELKKVATDEEWSSIKTIMRAIISGNVGSYKYLPAIELVKAEGQYSRDISVSASASKQMIDNYNAADLSAEGGSEEAPAGEAGSDPSIFPGGNEGPTDDNEVIPGIQEVTENDGSNEQNNPPVEEVVPPVAQTAPAEPIQDIAQPVAPPPEAIPSAPVPNVIPPAPTAPAAPEVIPGVVTPEAPQSAPAPEVVPPAVPMPPQAAPVPVEAPNVVADQLQETQTLTDEVQVPNLEMVTAQLPQVPLQVPVSSVAQPMPMPEMNPVAMVPGAPVENVPSISVAPEITPMPVQEVATATTVAQPVVVNTMPEAAQMMQVAQPTQVVPTAQIAQGIPEPTVVAPMKVDESVTPSFKPDATLEEVVKGAQDMFMEGVKNLVQTIQEKVYRDLYVKEAEMKKREALVAQKEQMLNTQFATMMSNITANFNGVTPDQSNINPQG